MYLPHVILFVTGSPMPAVHSTNTWWIIEWLAEWKFSFLDYESCAINWTLNWTLNKCLVNDMLLYFNPPHVQNSELAVDSVGISLSLRQWGMVLITVHTRNLLAARMQISMRWKVVVFCGFTWEWWKAWLLVFRPPPPGLGLGLCSEELYWKASN